MTKSARIPTVDLAAPEERAVGQLDAAFTEFGFCVCVNHGLPADLMAAAFEASRRFHALPPDEKARLAINRWHRGYIAPKSSTTLTSTVARVERPNTSESFMVMQEVAPEDPQFGAPLRGPNQWPEDLPGFRPAVEAYREAAGTFARWLTGLSLTALGADGRLLEKLFSPPTEFLRLLHYQAEDPSEPAESFGSAPHTDHGFLTMVAQDLTGGLEVQTRGGAWIPALPDQGALVINVADLLAHLSAGRWRSSPHRVKNRAGRDRYSIAYFFDPAMDAAVAPLPHLTGEASNEPPIVYGDYILSKFDTNYGYRQARS